MIVKTPYGTFDTNGKRLVVKVFDYETKRIYAPRSPDMDYQPLVYDNRDIVLPSFYYSEVYHINGDDRTFLVFDPGDGKRNGGRFTHVYYEKILHTGEDYYDHKTVPMVQIVRDEE